MLLLETYTSGVSRRSLCFEFNDAHGQHRWWSSHTDAIRFEVDEELCGRISVAAELQVLVVLEIEIVLLDRSDSGGENLWLRAVPLCPLKNHFRPTQYMRPPGSKKYNPVGSVV